MEKIKNLANGLNGTSHGKDVVNGAGAQPSSSPNRVGPTSPLVDDHPTPLKVLIIGAGIGGLSAAVGLRKNGHQVEVSPGPVIAYPLPQHGTDIHSLFSSFTSNRDSPMRLVPQCTWHPMPTVR